MRSYEDSLQRLGMTRVDALLIHDLDLLSLPTDDRVDAHFGDLVTGGFRALAELREAGVIGAIGAGVNLLGTIPRFLASLDLDFFLVAMPYTLADQRVLDGEFELCAERGVGIVVGAVFASGILATGPRRGRDLRLRRGHARGARPRAARSRRSVAGTTCRWRRPRCSSPSHHPIVASVIPGALSPEHVERNVAGMRLDIPVALWADLKSEGLIRADAPTP